MDFDTIKTICWVSFPIVSGIIAYFYKDLRSDLDDLKKKLDDCLTETQTRALIEDKITPIHEDCKEIKTNVNRIMDILLTKNS